MDSDGEEAFPILAAAKSFDYLALRRAIAAGADLHVEDEDNYTALHWLVNNLERDERNDNVNVRIACISALLDAGADVNRLGGPNDEEFGVSSMRCPPLLDAVFMCDPHPDVCRAERTIVDLLVRAGADPRIPAADGLTPLHMAAIWGNWHIVTTLLAAGADVNAIWPSSDTDGRGNYLSSSTLKTPLDAAIRVEDGKDRFRHRVHVMLLRAGARLPTNHQNLPPYLAAVAEAGGYARYERAHCERLAALFMPKPETGKGRRRSKRRWSPLYGLPAEVMHHIVSILWDCGGH